MPEKGQLSEEEGGVALALIGGIMTALTAGKPNAAKMQAALKQTKLDCGDGEMVHFDTPAVRGNVSHILGHLADDTLLVAKYMLLNPGYHSLDQLTAAAKSTYFFTEVIVFELMRRGFVRRAMANRTSGGPLRREPVALFRISTAVWLAHVKGEQEETDGCTDQDR